MFMFSAQFLVGISTISQLWSLHPVPAAPTLGKGVTFILLVAVQKCTVHKLSNIFNLHSARQCWGQVFYFEAVEVPIIQGSIFRSENYSVRPKTWPLFKNMPPPLCVSCRSLIFVSRRYIYVQYTTAVLLSYVGKCGQDEAFHMAIFITLQQKLCKKLQFGKMWFIL
jgi:hypothetical protein